MNTLYGKKFGLKKALALFFLKIRSVPNLFDNSTGGFLYMIGISTLSVFICIVDSLLFSLGMAKGMMLFLHCALKGVLKKLKGRNEA